MSYQSLYRKYRPQTFDEIVGQKHISETLKKSISTDKISHAYLFYGPRGTGKTSTARILAKTLNCETGLTATPCNKCETCIQITNGSFMDVIEMDAASNRGIDEIRDLKEKAFYSATSGRKRFYIIDEVHMLSREAFNALLKLLEEPPEHLILVLATTELHKVLPTITSRCQKYEFKPINSGDIAEKIVEIAQLEGKEIDTDAAHDIALAADGGLRDAISILEQLISYCPEKITREYVSDLVNFVDFNLLYEATNAIYSKNPAEVLMFVDKIAVSGIDLKNFALNLAKHFRNILAYKMNGVNCLIGINPHDKNAVSKLDEQSKLVSSGNAADIAMKIYESLFKFNLSDKRLSLEMLMFEAQSMFTSPLDTRSESGMTESSLPEVPQITKQSESEPEVITHIKQEKETDSNIAAIKNLWSEILETVKSKSPRTKALMIECQPNSYDGKTLNLLFRAVAQFHKTSVEKSPHIDILTSSIEKVLGKKVTIVCEIENEEVRHPDKSVLLKKKPAIKEINNINTDDILDENTIIDLMKKEFDAKIVE